MKKSRIAKLALSGAAVAALAATFSTSTYAWYVTNQTATVAAVTGSTASAASAGAISLSATGVAGSFKKALNIGNFSTASLSPVVTSDGKTFYSLNETVDADDTTAGKQVAATSAATVAKIGYGASDSGSVYCYRFFILAEGSTTDDNSTANVDESKTKVKPEITIKNTTGSNDFKSQINYSAGALTPNTITSGSTFYADALNALTMSSCLYQGTTLVSSLNNATAVGTAYTNPTTLNSVDVLSAGMTAGDSNRFATSTTNTIPGTVATAGAADYYEEISGNKLYDKTGSPKVTENNQYTGSDNKLGTITINNMYPVLLEFYLWLDGADDACFNACEQQDISVEFLFTVVQ